ncbi:MAG TPA: hypothetical protein ENH82_18405 [bacterium]|nr:hypothetical protein [bacterium]
MMKKIVISLLGVLLLIGCSSGKRLTVDTDIGFRDIHYLYPNERYLVRSGRGKTPQAATETARFEIAKYFESRISGKTLVRQWARNTKTRGHTIEDQLIELTNTIIVSSKREIPGIDIVKTEQVKLNIYEVWAVLEKSTYSGILRDRIQKIDKELDNRLSITYDSDILRARNLTQIIYDLILREQSREDIMLISPGLSINSRTDELHIVMSNLDNLIAEDLNIGLVFNGDMDKGIKSGMRKGIVDAGIRLKEYPDYTQAVDDKTDIIIMVDHTVTTYHEEKSGLRTISTIFDSIFSYILGFIVTTTKPEDYIVHWNSWILSLESFDSTTGKIIDTLVLNDKSSGKNDKQSHGRMVRKFLKSQVPAVSSWVHNVIFKPQDKNAL